MDVEAVLRNLQRTAGLPTSMEFRQFTARFTNLEVGFVTADEQQEDYIHSVVYPHDLYRKRERVVYTIACLSDPSSHFVDWILADSGKKIIDKGRGFEYGELSIGIRYTLPISHLFANFIISSGDEVLLICTGPHAEWGATSFLRTVLLRQYGKLPMVLVFHAASLVHIPTQRGVIISTEGYAEGCNRSGKNKKGKTTTMLATALFGRKIWALHTNDELVTSLENNQMRVFPFPSELVLKNGTIRGLAECGVFLESVAGFESTDCHTNETIRAVTNKSLANAGFTITPFLQRAATWIFVDIEPGDSRYDVEQLTLKAAFRFFCESIFRRRMAEMRSQLYEPEFDISRFMHKLQPTDFAKARELFCLLWYSGTKFFTLKGGVDYLALAQIVSRLLQY